MCLKLLFCTEYNEESLFHGYASFDLSFEFKLLENKKFGYYRTADILFFKSSLETLVNISHSFNPLIHSSLLAHCRAVVEYPPYFFQHLIAVFEVFTNVKNVINREFAAGVCKWFVGNKLSIHLGEDKTKCIVFSGEQNLPELDIICHNNKLNNFIMWNTMAVVWTLA